VIVTVGLPGAGKSTFASALEAAHPGRCVRVNQDDLGGGRAPFERALADALRASGSHGCEILDKCCVRAGATDA
jgi:predicted ABC-type ATPase